MVAYFSNIEGVSGNGAKAYKCSACGALITHSDRLCTISGKSRHRFVNPANIECDFRTFSSCQGAIALGNPTPQDTWFPGYGWRLALCRHCGQHLGWHYQAVSGATRPKDFWGVLVSQIVSKQSPD
jgi:hypothetical protein